MAKIDIDHQHGLEQQQARTKLEELAQQLEAKYKLQFTWQGERVQLKGTGVKGELRLDPGRISGRIEVPFILKGKVERALNERLDKEFPA